MGYAQHITDYQWKNRLVFLVDDTMDTKAIRSQLKTLIQEGDALVDRDILLFQLTPKGVFTSEGATTKLSADDTYRKLSIPKDFKGILLIAKDGGVKLKKGFEVKPELIFTLIDGMPMRRSELNRNKGN